MNKITASLVCLLLAAMPLRAQTCFNDLRYDDGTFENAFGTFSSARVHFTMRG